jgi:hypothetical protein
MMKRRLVQRIFASLLLLLPFGVLKLEAQIPSSVWKGSTMPLPQEGRVRAPELNGGRGWLNTDKPLSLAAQS